MWHQFIILLLLIGILASLARSFFFLMLDQGRSKRTAHNLGIRVTLAVMILVVLGHGLYSGEIQLAPRGVPTTPEAIEQGAAGR